MFVANTTLHFIRNGFPYNLYVTYFGCRKIVLNKTPLWVNLYLIHGLIICCGYCLWHFNEDNVSLQDTGLLHLPKAGFDWGNRQSSPRTRTHGRGANWAGRKSGGFSLDMHSAILLGACSGFFTNRGDKVASIERFRIHRHVVERADEYPIWPFPDFLYWTVF